MLTIVNNKNGADLSWGRFDFGPIWFGADLSENNIKITQFSFYLGVLFTWQGSHYQYQYGCSTNKRQMGLKVFRF